MGIYGNGWEWMGVGGNGWGVMELEIKKEKGRILNSQNCESRDDTAASRLQDINIGRRCIHCRRKMFASPFPLY